MSKTTEINPGIVKTVAALNAAGFETCDSGDGETHDFPCDREEGYVVIKVDQHDHLFFVADQVCRLLQVLKAPMLPAGEGSVLIQANYSPIDGLSFVDISGIHDRMLTFPVKE